MFSGRRFSRHPSRYEEIDDSRQRVCATTEYSTNNNMTEIADTSLIGKTIDGRFVIEEVIGEGGMATIYKARQLRVNRPVAIKTLNLQVDMRAIYHERFQLEIASLCALAHPNIVTVYDYVVGPNNEPCVVMDYLRGQDLQQLLLQCGPMGVERFATIFVQVCSALEHAHENGIIHRDIKPSNIVLMDQKMDFVKVVDFGLAKIGSESADLINANSRNAGDISINPKLTQVGELWGTPPYLSPEQATSKPQDERSDIYSLGTVMYEMLTGREPFFQAVSVYETIQCHINSMPPPLETANPNVKVPLAVQEVVFKCLRKNPQDRFQTVSALRKALVEACSSSLERDAAEALHQLASQAIDRDRQPMRRISREVSTENDPESTLKLEPEPPSTSLRMRQMDQQNPKAGSKIRSHIIWILSFIVGFLIMFAVTTLMDRLGDNGRNRESGSQPSDHRAHPVPRLR